MKELTLEAGKAHQRVLTNKTVAETPWLRIKDFSNARAKAWFRWSPKHNMAVCATMAVTDEQITKMNLSGVKSLLRMLGDQAVRELEDFVSNEAR